MAVQLFVSAAGVGALDSFDLVYLDSASVWSESWLSDDRWVTLFERIDYPTLLSRTWIVETPRSYGLPVEGLSLEFQYDCPCSGYHAGTDQTLDHTLLDLMFDPALLPQVVVVPTPTKALTPFDIRWSTYYEHEACVDPVGESGVIESVIEITDESGRQVDTFAVEVPSIRMGTREAFAHLYEPGLEAGRYSIRVGLNVGSPRAPECGSPEVELNNQAFAQVDVEDCTCPPNLGDLGIHDLQCPEGTVVGRSVVLSWAACYSSVCGSDTGETGPVRELLQIQSPTGEVLRELTFDEIETIPLGESVDRSFRLPDDLAAGGYRLRLVLDPDGHVPECIHAWQPEADEIRFKVVEPLLH